MKELLIKYRNGWIRLIPENYFPVNLKDAGKIFMLINRYCPEETRQELKEFLENKAEEYKKLSARLKKNKTLYERTLRNLKLLEEK